MPAAGQQAPPQHVQLYDAINALPSELVPPAADVAGMPERCPAPEWKTDDRFRAAMSLRALPKHKRYRLLLSMPHLTCGAARRDSNASLKDYRLAVGKLEQDLAREDGDRKQIFVHQTTFAVINNGLHPSSVMASAEPVIHRPHRHGAHGGRRHVQPAAVLPEPVPRQRVAPARAHGGDHSTVLDAARARSTARGSARTRPYLSLTQRHLLTSQQDLRAQLHTHVWSAGGSHATESRALMRDLGAYIADLSAISHLVQEQQRVLYCVAAAVRVSALPNGRASFNHDIFPGLLPMFREEHATIVLEALEIVVDGLVGFHARVCGLLSDARGMLRDTTGATNCVRLLRPLPPLSLLFSGLTRGRTTSHNPTRRPTITKRSRRGAPRSCPC